jgi:hypothetical protein
VRYRRGQGWCKFGRAHRLGLKLMPHLQAQVPDPLADDLPGLLPPGGVAAPAIGVEFLILIRKCRFKGAAMQIQFNDIAGGEPLLRQSGEEEFVDDAPSREANRTLLLARRMGRDDQAAQHAFRADWHGWTVIEATHDLAFWALLLLIRRQLQARLDEGVLTSHCTPCCTSRDQSARQGQPAALSYLYEKKVAYVRRRRLKRRQVIFSIGKVYPCMLRQSMLNCLK